MAIRVMVADDHSLVRESLRALFIADPQLELVGEAADGASAVELALKLLPDVVVMDLSMPRLSGLDATRRIHDEEPDVRVVVVSLHLDRYLALAALNAGACAYVVKNGMAAEVVPAVKAVADGRLYLCRQIAPLLCDEVTVLDATRQRAGGFSAREREVLDLLARGKSSDEAGSTLGLNTSALQARLRRIIQKLVIHCGGPQGMPEQVPAEQFAASSPSSNQAPPPTAATDAAVWRATK